VISKLLKRHLKAKRGRPVASGGQGGLSPPPIQWAPHQPSAPHLISAPHQPSVSAHQVWASATTNVGLCGVYGCPDRAAMRYSRGLQTFPVGGHINDFLRLGGANVKINSIYLKYQSINQSIKMYIAPLQDTYSEALRTHYPILYPVRDTEAVCIVSLVGSIWIFISSDLHRLMLKLLVLSQRGKWLIINFYKSCRLTAR